MPPTSLRCRAQVCLAAEHARGLQAALVGVVEPAGNRPPIRFTGS